MCRSVFGKISECNLDLFSANLRASFSLLLAELCSSLSVARNPTLFSELNVRTPFLFSCIISTRSGRAIIKCHLTPRDRSSCLRECKPATMRQQTLETCLLLYSWWLRYCSWCLKAVGWKTNVFFIQTVFLHNWHHSPYFFFELQGRDLKAIGGKKKKTVTVIEGLCVIIDICRTFLASCIHYLVNYSLFST